MLTYENARRIGLNACIDQLGREFVMKYKDSAATAYSTEPDENGNVFCFVGVDDHPETRHNRNAAQLILDNTSKFPYSASCNVNLENERTEYLECVLPHISHNPGATNASGKKIQASPTR